MWITALTVDEYLGFKYIIPTRLASHGSPYVKVLVKTGKNKYTSIAYILLKTKEIHFYDPTSEFTNKLSIIETWISKNINLCKKLWNQEHEVKV